jgi:hypothetical protein
MEFFDRKQEVLDIQLTPLGKRLLQMGHLKPEFYAFLDDDVVYDGKYCGITEAQNSVEERIKETPRLKQQTYLYSVEEKINKNTAVNDLPIFQENLFESMYLPGTTQKINPEAVEEKQLGLEGFGFLGNMAYNADQSPYWIVNFFEAGLTGSLSVTTGSKNQNVPKIECDVQYKVLLGETTANYASQVGAPNLISNFESFEDHEDAETFVSEDGSYFTIVEDSLFIKVEEKNTHFLNENFDIEIYKVGADGSEEKLYFEGQEDSDNENCVEYYFDVLVDSEIEDEVFCRAVKSEKLERTYTDKFIFNCPDVSERITVSPNVYDIADDEVEACD